MSGGYYDYKYLELQRLAAEIDATIAKSSRHDYVGWDGEEGPMEASFLDHMKFIASELRKLSDAAKDLEWVMSGDISEETLRTRESWKLSEEFRKSKTDDPVSLEWLDRTLKEWPKKQPGNGGAVPPSSPKTKLITRWNHWIKSKKIDPAVLYLACWKYQNTYFNNGNYVKALMNFLSPSAAMVPEWLEWAKAEAKRQGIR